MMHQSSTDHLDIVVLRALGGLGDVLTAVPALARLRASFPEARICYVGMPQVETVVARYPDLVDSFMPFPGFPGIPERPFDAGRLKVFLEFWRRLGPPDVVLQMHGSGSVSNVFAALLGASHTYGYHVPGLRCPDPDSYRTFPDHLSEADRWSELTTLLDCPAAGGAKFVITEDERLRRPACG